MKNAAYKTVAGKKSGAKIKNRDRKRNENAWNGEGDMKTSDDENIEAMTGEKRTKTNRTPIFH